MNYIPNLKYKTTMCLKWAQSNDCLKKDLFCDKGEACYFAHGPNDLRNLEENRITISAQNKVELQYRPAPNYKTIFCKFYSKGLCKLGEACTFAHERREKKNKSIQPEYPSVENYYPIFPYYPDDYQWPTEYGYPQYTLPQDTYFNDTHEHQVIETMKISIQTACEQGVSQGQKEKTMKGTLNLMQNLPRSNSINDYLQLEANQIEQ